LLSPFLISRDESNECTFWLVGKYLTFWHPQMLEFAWYSKCDGKLVRVRLYALPIFSVMSKIIAATRVPVFFYNLEKPIYRTEKNITTVQLPTTKIDFE
jgi:hypothetical protein